MFNFLHKDRWKDVLNALGINGSDYLIWIGFPLMEENISVNPIVDGTKNFSIVSG